MNRNLLIYLLFYFVCVKCEYEIWSQDSPEEEVTSEDGAMSSVLYKTVNKYFCSSETSAPSHLIIYGTKTWTFPPQNVNLTLSYPTADARQKLEEDDDNDDFIITGFSVVLYTDSDGSRGFITDGGILKDSIRLSFVSSNVSYLSYQFWLYGVTRRTHNIREWIAMQDRKMCS